MKIWWLYHINWKHQRVIQSSPMDVHKKLINQTKKKIPPFYDRVPIKRVLIRNDLRFFIDIMLRLFFNTFLMYRRDGRRI